MSFSRAMDVKKHAKKDTMSFSRAMDVNKHAETRYRQTSSMRVTFISYGI